VYPPTEEEEEEELPPSISAEDVALEEARLRLYRYRFFKPPVVLAIFTLINFFTYYDRGAISGGLPYLKGDRDIAGSEPLSDTAAGILTSVFMGGFLAFNPIFVALGGKLSSKSIIAIGLFAWCIAVVASGMSFSYEMLVAARMCVGIGEAAYAGFTVTIIDNICPKAHRTRWIGIFYSMIAVGTAAGIALNSVIASSGEHSGFAGWRVGFVWEAVPMGVLLVLVALMPRAYNVRPEDRDEPSAAIRMDSSLGSGLSMRPMHDDPTPHVASYDGVTTTPPHGPYEPAAGAVLDSASPQLPVAAVPSEPAAPAKAANSSHLPIHVALKMLAFNLDYWLLALGQAAYTWTLGAVSAFGVSMLTQSMGLSSVTASLFIGGSTSILGMGGTIIGGLVVDRLGGSAGSGGVFKCSLVSAACMFLAVPLGLIALSVESFTVFAILFVAACFFVFVVTAPINTSLLTVVDANIRPYSVAMCVFVMHLAGDVPSPIVTGALSDAFDDGCSAWKVEDACMLRNATNCRWMAAGSNTSADQPYCYSRRQLRDALRLMWLVMALCVLVWGSLAVRRFRQSRHEVGEEAASLLHGSQAPHVSEVARA
jgi:MFS family permease